ncbi:aspartate phosphatase [Shouchella sp. 1P09AA]|uniref:response regulator aspartate phosphatase n=1 Tax=unclassified Shouchella TaxID=2893065 RepID=UPI00399FD180
MDTVLKAEEVGKKIVEWHSCLIAKDIKQAKILKQQTDEIVQKMEPHDKMLAYYQLISFKHDLIVNYTEGGTLEAPVVSSVEIERDDYLNYMYYFVSGQHEFLNERYKSAIRTYKIAERLIEKVNDSAERADFYQELGYSYYRIDQYTFSYSYLEQALEFFEKNDLYIANVVRCKMILAAIHTEVGRYESAELIYNDLISLAKPFPFYNALLLSNMGLNRMTQKRYEEAIPFFEKALLIPELGQSVTSIKTKYNLLNAQLRTGVYISGLDDIESAAQSHNLVEITAKCHVSRGLYIENNFKLVELGLDLLKANNQYFDCAEICEEVSLFFENKGDMENALKYSRLSNDMTKQQTNLGVDQS